MEKHVPENSGKREEDESGDRLERDRRADERDKHQHTLRDEDPDRWGQGDEFSDAEIRKYDLEDES